jgi:hypothetical protein
MGFVHTFTVPYSPEMNGPAERSGGVLIKRARALIKEGKLPEKLWPEATAAAVYLLNRTPIRLDDGNWIIPWEEARQYIDQSEKPKTSLANLRLYGSLAYCRIPNIARLDKMKSRAEIGYLVGYVASNIWKIWMPHRGQVRMVRDAVFDETRRFSAENSLDEEVKLPLLLQSPPIILDEELEIDSILQGLNEQAGTIGTIGSTEGALGQSPTVGGADDARDPAKDVLDPPPTERESPEHASQDSNSIHTGERTPYRTKKIQPLRTPPRSPDNSDSATDQGVGGTEHDTQGIEGEQDSADLIAETPMTP